MIDFFKVSVRDMDVQEVRSKTVDADKERKKTSYGARIEDSEQAYKHVFVCM